MLALVTLVLEIEVMLYGLIPRFVAGMKRDYHIEFTPSLFRDSEWGTLECCA